MVQDGLDLVNGLAANTQISEEMYRSGVKPDGTAKQLRRCGRCREIGHRVEKCPIGH